MRQNKVTIPSHILETLTSPQKIRVYLKEHGIKYDHNWRASGQITIDKNVNTDETTYIQIIREEK